MSDVLGSREDPQKKVRTERGVVEQNKGDCTALTKKQKTKPDVRNERKPVPEKSIEGVKYLNSVKYLIQVS